MKPKEPLDWVGCATDKLSSLVSDWLQVRELKRARSQKELLELMMELDVSLGSSPVGPNPEAAFLDHLVDFGLRDFLFSRLQEVAAQAAAPEPESGDAPPPVPCD